MIKLTKTLNDGEIVSKLVFEDETAIAESVAYRYQMRGVVCFSVQSGCRIGCSFCGTGRRFLRDLTADEMVKQIEESLKVIGPRKRIQVMSMSMGEPMDNWSNVRKVVEHVLVDLKHDFYISTVGLNNFNILAEFVELGARYTGFGLQFSLHHWDDDQRRHILGNCGNLISVRWMRAFGQEFTKRHGRPCYFNYICNGNETIGDAGRVQDIAKGMHVTCSVMCDTRNKVKGDVEPARRFSEMLLSLGEVDTSIFDPAGQDTIGGGCGQLHYVQERLRLIEKSK